MREREAQYQLSNREFKFICNLVYDSTGIVLTEAKKEMVYRRLMRRVRALGDIDSFSQYCDLLGETDSSELPNFINAITTNLTSFFRESHHFDYLKETFIPQHIQEYGDSSRLRIWSSACSTGEEPYSLSITVHQAMADCLSDWDVKILATDLDTDVIQHAEQGVYDIDRVKDLPIKEQKRWFIKGKDDNQGLVKVKPELQDLIVFKQLNLLHEWPMRNQFDVILCRNVLIYFDHGTQEKLLDRFIDLLRPGGVIMLGHSESVAKSCEKLEAMGKTIYHKHRSLH